MTELAMLADR